MEHVRDSSKNLTLLSGLLLSTPTTADPATRARATSIASYPGGSGDLISGVSPKDLEDLKALAMTNHEIMRAFAPLQDLVEDRGRRDGAQRTADAIRHESARIDHALGFLARIGSTLEEGGCPVTVIKSLDHWPDLGSDLDLYTDADPARIVDIMRVHFKAELADRSWGDRLANKWNFVVPGLPELIEVHAGRLGQTGEQTAVTRSVSTRTRMAGGGGDLFPVPAPEERLIISTLQRMYRHFYLRLCDVVDTA